MSADNVTITSTHIETENPPRSAGLGLSKKSCGKWDEHGAPLVFPPSEMFAENHIATIGNFSKTKAQHAGGPDDKRSKRLTSANSGGQYYHRNATSSLPLLLWELSSLPIANCAKDIPFHALHWKVMKTQPQLWSLPTMPQVFLTCPVPLHNLGIQSSFDGNTKARGKERGGGDENRLRNVVYFRPAHCDRRNCTNTVMNGKFVRFVILLMCNG